MKYINNLWHLTVCLCVYLTKFMNYFNVKVRKLTLYYAHVALTICDSCVPFVLLH